MCKQAVVFIVALSAVSAANLFRAEMPKDCVGKTYCHTKSELYPQKHMDILINKTLINIIEVGDKIQNRDGAQKPSSDCERDPKFEEIYEIMDKDGNVRFVAQSDGLFIQKVRTETCLNPGRLSKSAYFDVELENYDFVCEESFMKYSFLVLSLNGESLEDVEVSGGLPICCSCRVYDKKI